MARRAPMRARVMEPFKHSDIRLSQGVVLYDTLDGESKAVHRDQFAAMCSMSNSACVPLLAGGCVDERVQGGGRGRWFVRVDRMEQALQQMPGWEGHGPAAVARRAQACAQLRDPVPFDEVLIQQGMGARAAKMRAAASLAAPPPPQARVQTDADDEEDATQPVLADVLPPPRKRVALMSTCPATPPPSPCKPRVEIDLVCSNSGSEEEEVARSPMETTLARLENKFDAHMRIFQERCDQAATRAVAAVTLLRAELAAEARKHPRDATVAM